MQRVKFRWRSGGKIHYREVLLPVNAQQLMYVDKVGVEVYDGEIVYNGEHEDQTSCTLDDFLAEYKDYISLDCWELERVVYKDSSDLSDRVYHEPIRLEAEEDAD